MTLIKSGNKNFIINYQDIYYIETFNNNLTIHLQDMDDITIYSTLKEYADKLPPNFLRCHKCYMVNMNHIKSYEPHKFVISTGESIPLPPKKYKNFLILGNTGTGKTCVASAIANAVLDKGYTVMFLTAFDFTRLMTKYHTTPISDRGIYIEDILSSDLLVLDDLGSEQRIRNVTVEYLFRVLSTRQNHGKCTVYTSNLSLKDGSLKDFYGDRVFSRLVDKNNTFVFEFDGEDVRQ